MTGDEILNDMRVKWEADRKLRAAAPRMLANLEYALPVLEGLLPVLDHMNFTLWRGEVDFLAREIRETLKELKKC